MLAINREIAMANLPMPAHLIPASFGLGRLWFAAFVSPYEIQRAREVKSDRYGNYFPIEDKIAELGFETFIPLERKIQMRQGRKLVTATPVFGQYIFVAFDPEADDWWQINHTPGVLGVLSTMNVPRSISSQKIEAIRRAEENGLFGGDGLAAGDEVRITDGPFSEMIGKVRSATKRKRIRVLLDCFGSVDVDACYLEKIK